jgi:hypothetical protein
MEGSLTSPRNGYYYQVAHYKIEKQCYEANPCSHYVIDTETGLCKLMSGKNIFLILRKYNTHFPHFNYLKDRVFIFFCCSIYSGL